MRNQIETRNAAVATPHQEAAVAAQGVLDRGGNAVDAAVTAVLALCVATPAMVGIGGYGGTMLVYLAKERKVVALDFDSRCPFQYSAELYKDPAVANYGYLAV